MPIDKDKFEMYASYKIEAAILDEKMEELRPQIVEMMKEAEADKVGTSFGAFTLTQNRKWSFTEGVEIIRANLKAEEAKEKADGSAKYEETPVLKFTSKKDKADILG